MLESAGTICLVVAYWLGVHNSSTDPSCSSSDVDESMLDSDARNLRTLRKIMPSTVSQAMAHWPYYFALIPGAGVNLLCVAMFTNGFIRQDRVLMVTTQMALFSFWGVLGTSAYGCSSALAIVHYTVAVIFVCSTSIYSMRVYHEHKVVEAPSLTGVLSTNHLNLLYKGTLFASFLSSTGAAICLIILLIVNRTNQDQSGQNLYASVVGWLGIFEVSFTVLVSTFILLGIQFCDGCEMVDETKITSNNCASWARECTPAYLHLWHQAFAGMQLQQQPRRTTVTTMPVDSSRAGSAKASSDWTR